MPHRHRKSPLPIVFEPQPSPFEPIRDVLLVLKACVQTLRQLDERKYSPDQPRWSIGDPRGGQWKPKEGGNGNPDDETETLLASNYSFGQLIAEFETGRGRRCVYRFDFGTFVVPGPDNFLCPRKVPSSAASHGRYLNDN